MMEKFIAKIINVIITIIGYLYAGHGIYFVWVHCIIGHILSIKWHPLEIGGNLTM